jgi:hypothetical protein
MVNQVSPPGNRETPDSVGDLERCLAGEAERSETVAHRLLARGAPRLRLFQQLGRCGLIDDQFVHQPAS